MSEIWKLGHDEVLGMRSIAKEDGKVIAVFAGPKGDAAQESRAALAVQAPFLFDENARLRALNAELIAAFRDVLQWAGKDKRRLKRQWKMTALELISMQGQSLNRSYEAIAHAEDSNARER